MDKDKEDQPLHVTQSNNGLLTFKKTKINKVDGWAIWNKAFRIFIEIYCLKFSSKCINLVQYVGILNNLAGKFPFTQVYNHYKDFRQEMEQDQDLPWHKIDQQLWLTSLHGIHMINSSRGRMAGSKDSLFARNKTGPFTTALTTVGGCSRQSCSFPYICSYCGSPNHTMFNCPTHQDRQKQYQSTTGQQQSNTNPQGHTQCRAVCPSNAPQGGSSSSAAATSSSTGHFMLYKY